MKRVIFSAVIAVLFGMFSQAQAAGDAAAGKAKADSCKGCHGAEGQGVGKNPPLAGKKEGDLVAALKDYKSGKRANAPMKTFASKLSDEDMANVAAFYASLPAKK